MPTFKSLKNLEKHVQKKLNSTIRSPQVQSIFREAMIDSVYTEVYDASEPREYERRYEDGGLSDARNMVFTKHELIGKTYSSDFENLTVGSDSKVYGHDTDSMSGFFISELIENGSEVQHTSPSNSKSGWYDPDGAWSDPRPFAKGTAERLNKSTYNTHLKHALEHGINN